MKFQKTELFSKKTQFLFFQQGKNWGFFLNFSEFDFYLKNPLIEPWLFCVFSASSSSQNPNFFPEFFRIRFLFKKSADRAVAFCDVFSKLNFPEFQLFS